MSTVRISSLPTVGRCPAFGVLRSLTGGSSPAAHTGTAVGRLIELTHQGAPYAEALARTQAEAPEAFPDADLDYVMQCGLAYCSDARNRDVVVGELCEREVTVSLAPSPRDPTGEPIQLVGHVDQIRRERGQLYVWDLKNGRPSGIDLLYGYAWQIAAYAVAASNTLGEPVLPGGIIRLRGYIHERRKNNPDPNEANVFYAAPWTLEQCHAMLGNVVEHIALQRSGVLLSQPGTHCEWCPASGPHTCADEIERMNNEEDA